jgi:pyrroloquinoline quinone (PQQ) biosynthesis protein C
MGPLQAASDRMMAHPEIREVYPEYLVALHGFIRASVPLMQAAQERARALRPEDPVAARLVDYLEEHVVEETGHDEWVLEDLERLGIERATVLARVPSPTIARLIGAQYYWALHYHPAAVLGHLLVTEGYPTPPGLIEELIDRTGLPREAFRTVVDHSELDPEHGDELDRLIDELPLSREQEEVVTLSAMSSVELVAVLLEEVCDTAEDGRAAFV